MSLDKDYPNFDWDNFDINSFPDIWKIKGTSRSKKVFYNGKVIAKTIGFEISTEYPSEKEAIKKIESMKTDPQWCEERVYNTCENGPLGYIEYENVNFHDLTCYKTKPLEATRLARLATFRGLILSEEKIFPICLP
jgi:hypothetical protein